MATRLPTYDPTDFGNKPGDGPLRVAGETAAEPPKKDRDLPSTLSAAAARQVEAAGICRDLWGGTQTVRAKGTLYLPKNPGEEDQNYRNRLARSVFHNFFRRTVDGLVGLIFRKDPVLGDDVPVEVAGSETVDGHWENIDLAGTHGDVFLRELETDAMQIGHAAIFVDYPQTGGTQTRADEVIGGIRPYWIPVHKENILSWRTTNTSGHTTLTQVVLREVTMVDDGEYGETEQTRYRVLRNTDGLGVVTWQLLEITKDKQLLLVDEGGYPTQNEIPISEVSTSGRRGMFESDPPLLDVADLNIAHYQQNSDYATSIHKTCVPILWGAGFDNRDETGNQVAVVVGPDSSIWSADPQAKLGYAAHDGGSLGSVKASLDDIKSDIGSLGLAMLAPQKRVAETADAKRLDKSTSDSALSVSARALQDGVERALGFHARYLGLDAGGSIKINRDFEGLLMDPDVMRAYAVLVQQAGFPREVVLRALKEGGRIPEDMDVEELELQMQAEGIANDMNAAQEAADQAGDTVEDMAA